MKIRVVVYMLSCTATFTAAFANPIEASATGDDRVIENSTQIDSDSTRFWTDAQACVETLQRLECYASEDALLNDHPDLVASLDAKRSASSVDDRSPEGVATSSPGAVTMASCAPSVRLYRSTSFGGSVLYLTTRGMVLNLANYGFDNDTSSYSVGGCSASFFSAANAGGSVYPGWTAAGSSSASMVAGWDNTVSSVYIN